MFYSSCMSHCGIMDLYIYSVDTLLYSYTLPLIHLPYSSSSLCLSCNLSSSLRSLHIFTFEQPNIAIIGIMAFLYVSKLLGFELYLCSSNIQANSTKLAETPNLFDIPSKYHKFSNVFSKTKAEVLASYYPYDLQINLEEGAQPLVKPIFFRHLNKRLSRNSLRKTLIQVLFNQSLYGTPILFIKKKDRSLCLCINFYGLNCISKKNCYLLLLISNLLDSPCKAQVYSKIDLCHAYYLIHIANGDEWITAFKICYRSFE